MKRFEDFLWKSKKCTCQYTNFVYQLQVNVEYDKDFPRIRSPEFSSTVSTSWCENEPSIYQYFIFQEINIDGLIDNSLVFLFLDKF